MYKKIKTILIAILVLGGLISFILFLAFIMKKERVDIGQINAEVIAIDSNILDGKLIGQFLGSSSGYIKNDKIIVGVRFYIYGNIFLEDLSLSHSQLANAADSNTIKLFIVIYKDPTREGTYLKIRYCGYLVKKSYISNNYFNDLKQENLNKKGEVK